MAWRLDDLNTKEALRYFKLHSNLARFQFISVEAPWLAKIVEVKFVWLQKLALYSLLQYRQRTVTVLRLKIVSSISKSIAHSECWLMGYIWISVPHHRDYKLPNKCGAMHWKVRDRSNGKVSFRWKHKMSWSFLLAKYSWATCWADVDFQ